MDEFDRGTSESDRDRAPWPLFEPRSIHTRSSGPRSSDESEFEGGLDGELAVERRKKTRKPRRYRVLLHNDDYTTTEFVVDILMRYFAKQHAEAVQVMMQVHLKGVGTAGIYPKDVAETKIHEVTTEARAQSMPLLLTKEPE